MLACGVYGVQLLRNNDEQARRFSGKIVSSWRPEDTVDASSEVTWGRTGAVLGNAVKETGGQRIPWPLLQR
jgi:hypothetical protein